MAMIEFVRNYSDRSTDRGYQFEFHCDHCGNGYMSSYEASLMGTAGGLLQAAGSIFGGLLGSAGNSSYEIQRAIGGPAHDHALQTAVAEVKQKFRQCQLCGKWVCAEICWNERAAQCTGCTPKYEQEVISMRTHAQISATQQQLQEKAANTDYVSGIDMNPDVQVQLNSGGAAQGLPAPGPGPSSDGWTKVPAAAVAPVGAAVGGTAHCTACGGALTGGKFCPECGAAVAPVAKTCAGCGHVSAPGAKFCEQCGGKLG
jgi:hypothetical protein